MKTAVLSILMFLLFSAGDFKSEQMKYARVKEAYQDKEQSLRQLYQEKGVDFSAFSLFIRVFKYEKELELWARNNKGKYTLINTYEVCSASGYPGPKRKMGDYQVPEGFYHIDRFNPYSSYHLSLGLNYPNASDKILSDAKSPGGDIFIHGYCASIGCMAMTNDKIKEIYIAAIEARNNGQSQIPVHIFPFRMSEEKLKLFSEHYKDYPSLLTFWQNLQPGYDHFEKNKQLPSIGISNTGSYKIN